MERQNRENDQPLVLVGFVWVHDLIISEENVLGQYTWVSEWDS